MQIEGARSGGKKVGVPSDKDDRRGGRAGEKLEHIPRPRRNDKQMARLDGVRTDATVYEVLWPTLGCTLRQRRVYEFYAVALKLRNFPCSTRTNSESEAFSTSSCSLRQWSSSNKISVFDLESSTLWSRNAH